MGSGSACTGPKGTSRSCPSPSRGGPLPGTVTALARLHEDLGELDPPAPRKNDEHRVALVPKPEQVIHLLNVMGCRSMEGSSKT